MKVVASNIFDFTSCYKFGYKFIASELILDLADSDISGEELLKKTGFFEEEHEVFYLELPEIIIKEIKGIIQISLHDVRNLIPLTEKGGKLLASKIPDFKISSSIPFEIANKLIEERNRQLAIAGGKHLLASFNQIADEQIIKYQEAFMTSLLKYINDLNAEQDSVLDNILFYERSKPYPMTDWGFLFDVGGIARTRFNLIDDDFKNKMVLLNTDRDKYELVENLQAFSKFLQSKQTDKVWSEFLSEYSANNLLQRLSCDLYLIKDNEQSNNILTIALFLKFRYMIRNTSNLEDKQFTNSINQFLKNVPNESKVALFFTGMFFGSIKFKELYYKFVPLNISRFKYQTSANNIKDERNIIIENEQDAINKDVTPDIILLNNSPSSNQETHLNSSQPILEVNSNSFDELFWTIFEKRITKYSSQQKKIIKDCYFAVINFKGDLFTGRTDFLINMLKKKMKDSKAKKPDSMLSSQIIEEIHSILKEYLNEKI